MDRVQDAVDTTYSAFLAMILPLTALAILLVEPLLHLLRIDQSAYAEARSYMLIVCAGLIGNVGYNFNAGILRGLGDSRTPLLFLILATGLNIVLDLAAVIVFHLGVAGVAYATIIAEGVSWLVGVVYINRHYSAIHLSLLRLRFDRPLLREIVRIGLPAGAQTALVSIGMMAVTGRVNSYGETYTAAYNMVQKIDGIAMQPIQSLAVAATAFVGQNLGADKPSRVRSGTRATLVMMLLWCLITDLVILPLREPLAAIFTDTPLAIHICGSFALCLLPCYPLFGVMFCLNSIMRGAGESVVPLLVALVGQIFCRVPSVYLLAHLFGPDYMFLGFGFGWAVGAVLASAYYLSGRWKRHGSVAAQL